MPCLDNYPNESYVLTQEHNQVLAELRVLGPAMCALLNTIKSQYHVDALVDAISDSNVNKFIDVIDFSCSGITADQLKNWYRKRMDDDAALRKEQLKQAALSKLTVEERKALGLE